jgi:formylmethanofuran dehydrogenase subunit D
VTPRAVTGMPAHAGAANALVTPGTTSTATPASTGAR